MEKAAKIFSRIFSPLLVPSMAIAVSLWITPLTITPDFVKIRVVCMTMLITGAIPGLSIVTMKHFNQISDTVISNRKERLIPFIITVFCYMAQAYYLVSIHAPLWLCNFMISAMFAIVIIMVINVFWKISGHTCALGGFVALLAWLIANDMAFPSANILLLILIVISGAVGSARLIRNLHTLGQVVAGFTIGFSSVYIFPYIINNIIH